MLLKCIDTRTCGTRVNIFYQLESFCIIRTDRSSHPEVLLGKGVLKICHKFTEEHPSQSAVSITLLCNFIEITLRHGCSPVKLLHIFRATFLKNTSGQLHLKLNVNFHQFCYMHIILADMIIRSTNKIL